MKNRCDYCNRSIKEVGQLRKHKVDKLKDRGSPCVWLCKECRTEKKLGV